MFAPIFNFRGLHGVGPRVAEHTINAIPMHPFPSYEDVLLRDNERFIDTTHQPR